MEVTVLILLVVLNRCIDSDIAKYVRDNVRETMQMMRTNDTWWFYSVVLSLGAAAGGREATVACRTMRMFGVE